MNPSLGLGGFHVIPISTESKKYGKGVDGAKFLGNNDPVKLLVKARGKPEPWWPGSRWNDHRIHSAGAWGDIGPCMPGDELRAGRPCVRSQQPQNGVFMPGTRTMARKIPYAPLGDRGANDSHGGRGDWRQVTTTSSELGPRGGSKYIGIKTSVFDASAQTTPEPFLGPPESRGSSTSTARPLSSRSQKQVPYLPTHHDPVKLEIAEALKGKPLVCMGRGFSSSREKNASHETMIVTTAVDRHRPQTARARLGGGDTHGYQRMTNEERRKAADDLAKTWCSRPNTVRGTRRLKVARGGSTAPGGVGEDAEPAGSWGDVREVSRTRKGATAPCAPWTPLLGRQWVMPADLVDFEHYASAQPGGGSITKRVTIAPTPTPEEEERQKAIFAVTRHKQPSSSEAAGAHNGKARPASARARTGQINSNTIAQEIRSRSRPASARPKPTVQHPAKPTMSQRPATACPIRTAA